MWGSEGISVALVLSFHGVGPGDGIRVTRPGHRHMYPLSHAMVGGWWLYLLSHLEQARTIRVKCVILAAGTFENS